MWAPSTIQARVEIRDVSKCHSHLVGQCLHSLNKYASGRGGTNGSNQHPGENGENGQHGQPGRNGAVVHLHLRSKVPGDYSSLIIDDL